MSTLTLQLDDVAWGAVVAAVNDRRDPGDAPPHVGADALSLSALFADDFHEGLRCIAVAREAEPLNPIHAVRQVLFLLRFGVSGRALELARSLQEQLPGLALPAYLRALATHREGEYKRAANAAAEVVAAHPAFVPARFLQAESQLRSQFKGLRRLLTGLPRGEVHAPNWLDIVAKLVLSGGEEGRSLAAEVAANPANLPLASREKALADELLELGVAQADTLEEKLAATRPGSRAEEVVLLFFDDRIDDKSSPGTAVEALRLLLARFPDRQAVRRVYVTRLTRMAVDLASREKYAEALRLVERCLELEPHETVHRQNRAALFTLLREKDAYHNAWFELDRHQYRLALLGRIDVADAIAMAKPHRLFAQQARLPAGGPGDSGGRPDLGFLMETTRTNEGASETVLALNNDRIDDDPDLLRQWLYHRRAELTFTHWALGMDPRRFLLDPDHVPAARARLASLAWCSRALGVLVPQEGRLLAGRLVAAWTDRAGRIDPAYAPMTADPEVRALKLLHLETFGDLALLCLNWKPDATRPDLVEEVLALLRNEGPFFDDSLLHETLQERQREASYPLKLLAGFINNTAGLDGTHPSPLDEKRRAGVTGRLAAELLMRLAFRTYELHRGTESGAGRALVYIERARGQDPENVRIELAAARFLLIAGHDAESKAALAGLQRSARARDPEVHSEIEELRQILEERAKSGVSGRRRTAEVPETVPEAPAGAYEADLESEIDRFPGSIQAYEELARKLVAGGRLQDAVDWSERAMTQCLGRDGQLRARSLNMEVIGLRKLWERDQGAVRLYVTGSHRSALEALEALPESDSPDYMLAFLLGHCRLALGCPEEARQAFERALEHCGRQLHRTVLRGLALDVDQPYLMVARRSIADKIGAGAFEPALREAWAMMAHLRRPEPALIDLAQIHLDAAMAGIGTVPQPLPAPTGPELQLCGGRLAEVYSVNSDLERARRLAALSLATHDPSRRKAELLLRKADTIEEQMALADVLARSGARLREGQFAEALAALDEVRVSEPRVVRQRALLLLKLERFEQAQAQADSLRGSTSPIAKEVIESFPSLLFRQRIAAASRLLREGKSIEALAVLEGAVARSRDDSVELAYCRGFGLTMDAYRLRRAGEHAGAIAKLTAAMDCVEPSVAAARSSGHARLIELYETLDKELDH